MEKDKRVPCDRVRISRILPFEIMANKSACVMPEIIYFVAVRLRRASGSQNNVIDVANWKRKCDRCEKMTT